MFTLFLLIYFIPPTCMGVALVESKRVTPSTVREWILFAILLLLWPMWVKSVLLLFWPMWVKSFLSQFKEKDN